MLVIRKEQMDEMKKSIFDNFIDEMTERARIRHPEKTAGMEEEKLREVVSEEILSARESGLTLKGHMKRYLDISFSVRPGFGKERWANEILSNSELIPAAKLHNLERAALFRVR